MKTTVHDSKLHDLPVTKIPTSKSNLVEVGDGRSLALRARLWSSKIGPALALAWCLVHFTTSARAQSYNIDWYTIDGGGGTSAGGVFTVTGTVGQPDAGSMSGGNWSVAGGFWGLITVVLTPGAPTLTIHRTPTNTVAVSWPSPSAGWTLQQNTNGVATVNWSNVTTTIQDDGIAKTLIVNPPAGSRYYRLKSP